MGHRLTAWIGMLAAAALTLAGCRNAPPFEPPPRADDAIEIPPQSSVIAVPITADLTDLSAQLAREEFRETYGPSIARG